MRRLIIQGETKRDLEKQIFYKQTVQEFEQEQSKKRQKTSFGPEENELLYHILEKRIDDAKQINKSNLEKLIRERANKHEFMSQLEKGLD